MHLVIQGVDVATPDLKHLAKLADASSIEAITPQAFRLRHAQPDERITGFCEERELDFAFVPENRSLSDFRLLVMDMDSTLITIETIDELADLVGLKPQVAAITARAMRGEIEYDESLRRRVALLKGLDASALDRVYDERLKLTPGADKLLAAVKGHGLKTLLVSGGFTFFTDRLRARLSIDHVLANVLELRDGRLTGGLVGEIVDAQAKAARFADLAARARGGGGLALAIGDGANDLPMLAQADVSVAYRAKPVVRAQAMHAIDHCGLDAVLNLFA